VAFWVGGRLVDAMAPAPSARGEGGRVRNVYRVDRRAAIAEVSWWLVV
jgi:hypothetical protein